MTTADNKDWRRKYAELVHSFEAEERHYREQVQSLRRLVTRLCLLAQDQSPAVDAELQKLKTLLARDDAGTAEFDALSSDLARALHTLEQQPVVGLAVATASDDTPTPALASGLYPVFARLLAELRHDDQLADSVDAMQAELAQQPAPDKLPSLLSRIAELVTVRIHRLDQGRQDLQTLLTHLASSLEQMAHFAAGDAEQLERQARARDNLASLVSTEVQALSQSLDRGDALADLRQQLGTRLAAIAQHLQVFRQRETESLTAMQARNRHMQERIRELEGKTKQLQDRLQQEQRTAMLDSLTGIPNRLAWDLHSVDALAHWQHSQQPTCIAAWDVDHFKAVNDEGGHSAGDRALKHIADCLRKHLRSSDFLARYGGEEFVMLLPGATLQDAVLMAERIREAVTRIGFHMAGKRRPLSISCGITALQAGDDTTSAFERADAALYQAKRSGRDRVIAG